MLEATDLTFRTPTGRLVLDHLPLRVGGGEWLFVAGSSGAGKTVALDMFLGLRRPSGGRVLVDGVPVAEQPIQARRRIGYVPGAAPLDESLTAWSNLEFFIRLATGRPPARDALHELLLKVGFPANRANEPAGRLSPPLRQKLRFAVVLAKDPPNLILDNPFSGLDPATMVELLDLLAALRDEGKAVLMAGRDLFRAARYADRVAILEEGRIVLELTREEMALTNLETISLAYLGAGSRG